MVSHKVHTILVFCFLLIIQVYAETKSSIEIEGKFVNLFEHGREILADTKINFSWPVRQKRAAAPDDLLFLGKLTLRETNGKVTVIGVNATFHGELVDEEENDLGSNRVKRAAHDNDDQDRHDETSVWFYGQFALNDIGPTAEVVRVRLNLNSSQTYRRVPYTGSDLEPKTEVGFRGKLTASNGHSSKDVLDISGHLGFQRKPLPNRVKREEPKTTLSINGELRVEMTSPYSDTVFITISQVKGDATIEPKLASDGHSPYDQFLTDVSNPSQYYCKADGNLTVKSGGSKIFEVPLGTSLLVGKHRTKRDTEEEVEVEYHGIFETPRDGHNARARMSAVAKFWLISKV